MANAPIVLTGLSLNDPVPGNYTERLFAQGNTAGFAGQRPILLIGNKTSAGNGVAGTTLYGPDTPIQAQTEQDVINLTGTGSELHIMWLDASRIAGGTSSIYFIIVTSSVGASATLVFTFLNVPSASGNVRIWIDDEFVDTAFASGDTLATLTANIVLNASAKTRWPVTGAVTTVTTSSDSVTFTARVPGPRGNFHRGMATISTGSGATSNMTVTNTVDVAFASGTTADDSTAALATILASRFYYIASAAEDATQVGALVTQVNLQALPVTGICQRVFAGSVAAQSAIDTIATGLNAARADVWWQKNGLITPCRMAARAAAIFAVEENSGGKPKCNFSSYPRNDSESANWGNWPPPRDLSAWPTRPVVKTALLNGVTPIGVRSNGATYLVKAITTKCLNGASPDYRIRDHHKVTIIDFFADDGVQKENDQLGGKNLSDDVAQGQPPPPPDTTTPARFRDLWLGMVDTYGNDGMLQKTAITKAEAIFQRESGNTSRLSASIPLYPCDILDQTAVVISQVG